MLSWGFICLSILRVISVFWKSFREFSLRKSNIIWAFFVQSEVSWNLSIVSVDCKVFSAFCTFPGINDVFSLAVNWWFNLMSVSCDVWSDGCGSVSKCFTSFTYYQWSASLFLAICRIKLIWIRKQFFVVESKTDCIQDHCSGWNDEAFNVQILLSLKIHNS